MTPDRSGTPIATGTRRGEGCGDDTDDDDGDRTLDVQQDWQTQSKYFSLSFHTTDTDVG